MEKGTGEKIRKMLNKKKNVKFIKRKAKMNGH